jgi:drug/metabolite transporter (DMT)-like permease
MTKQIRPHAHPDRRAVVLATLGVVLAAFCWGISAIFAKGAFERGIPPVRMAEARIAVAGIPLLLYLLLRRRDLLVPPRAARGAILVFGLGLVAVNAAYYTAIDRLPVGIAISIQYTGPVLVLIFSALMLRRAPDRRIWAAGLVTLAGAVLVSGAYAGLGSLDPLGVAAAAVSAITFAIYLLSAEAAGRWGAHSATTLGIGFLVAAVAWGAWLPWWSWPFDRLADPEIVLRVLGVGLVGTLLPFLLMVTALRVISAGVAGIAATSEPVFASGLAWLLLGQALELPQLVGGALVVAGVVLAQVTRGGAAGESVAVEVAA